MNNSWGPEIEEEKNKAALWTRSYAHLVISNSNKDWVLFRKWYDALRALSKEFRHPCYYFD